MNTEKLYSIAKAYVNDCDATNAPAHFQNVIGALQNVINSQSSQTQQALSAAISTFSVEVAKSGYPLFPPTWKKTIHDFSPGIIMGQDLVSWVESVLQRNQITYALAMTEFTTMQAKITNLHSYFSTVVSIFGALGLEMEELAVGECEVGVLIPRASIDNEFTQFYKELEEFDFVFKAFSEYVEGKKSTFKLKSISASDFMFYVGAGVGITAAIAKSVDWILGTYKKILEIKELKARLDKLEVPEKATKEIENHSNDLMKLEIGKLIEMLSNEHCGITDTARKNEVENGVRIALNKIANRIDAGFSVEVRIWKQTTGESEPEVDASDAKAEQIVRETESRILFTKPSSEKILSLPEDLKSTK